MTERQSVEQSVRDIRHRTRKKYSAEEKIPVVLEGLRAESMLA
jgi:transposase